MLWIFTTVKIKTTRQNSEGSSGSPCLSYFINGTEICPKSSPISSRWPDSQLDVFCALAACFSSSSGEFPLLLLHLGKEEPKGLWCSQAKPGQWGEAQWGTTSRQSHSPHSHTLSSLLGRSFLLGTNIWNYRNMPSVPWGPEHNRSPVCCQRMSEWARLALGKTFPVPYICSHALSRLYLISNQRFSGLQVWLFIGLRLHACVCSGLRKPHYKLGGL